MSDPYPIILVTATLAGLAMLLATTLTGWRDWLRLKHRQLGAEPAASPSASARIELADLRERIRKLEAIAAGVEL